MGCEGVALLQLGFYMSWNKLNATLVPQKARCVIATQPRILI